MINSPHLNSQRLILAASAVACVGVALALIAPSVRAQNRSTDGGVNITLPTTVDDYFLQGTQPSGALDGPAPFHPISPSFECSLCHSNYGPEDPFLVSELTKPWAGSMMGQSARDPIFHAALTIANQSATGSGAYCIRCHAPVAFLNSTEPPTDVTGFVDHDWEGLNCNFCHRMVDRDYEAGVSPPQDQQILSDLSLAGLLPPQGSNSRYIVDPVDSRRGPFHDIPKNIHPGDPQPEIVHSPFHSQGEFCWTCHDVSNPLMNRVSANNFTLNELSAAHPTGEQEHMLPLHRTYSEWKNSYYSTIGVQHDGRFGGNHPTGVMTVCQDCHMPRVEGFGCTFQFPPFFSRPDLPQHSFMGSNYWVLNAIRTVDADENGEPDFPDTETGLTDEVVGAAIERNVDFLQRASDLFLTRVNDKIRARLLNLTGHKLPTGFPDGRRIWLNVRFYDCSHTLVGEHGAYDFDTATLTPDTKIYEIKLGINGADYATQLGLPEGETFHFMLANKILKDNRIPPAGHANSLAAQMQTQSVGAIYQNGQNWDDTLYTIPAGARSAVVTAYYQLTSREFIEFLRDANITDNRGQVAYNLWVDHGMSSPIPIDVEEITLHRREDIDKDGQVGVSDLLSIIGSWGACPAIPLPCPADINNDRTVGVPDLLAVIAAWGC